MTRGFPPHLCNLVLFGDIERGDDEKFTRELSRLLKRDCTSPTVYLYSRGGDVETAIAIAEQIFALRLHTASPTSSRPDGPRYCRWLPGSDERRQREAEITRADAEAVQRSLKDPSIAAPQFPVFHGDYDPRYGIGDPRCTCASACFFIWAAGAEREGDVIVIHRPYVDPQQYAMLSADEAQAAYKKLADKVRDFLVKIGIDNSLIEKMMRVDSEHALPLTSAELASLRIAPYWQELKLANCPKDDTDIPSDIKAPGDLEQIMDDRRKLCWNYKQDALRSPLIEAYLRSYGGPHALVELYAFRLHVDPDDPGLDDYLDCRRQHLNSCRTLLRPSKQNPAAELRALGKPTGK